MKNHGREKETRIPSDMFPGKWNPWENYSDTVPAFHFCLIFLAFYTYRSIYKLANCTNQLFLSHIINVRFSLEQLYIQCSELLKCFTIITYSNNLQLLILCQTDFENNSIISLYTTKTVQVYIVKILSAGQAVI